MLPYTLRYTDKQALHLKEIIELEIQEAMLNAEECEAKQRGAMLVWVTDLSYIYGTLTCCNHSIVIMTMSMLTAIEDAIDDWIQTTTDHAEEGDPDYLDALLMQPLHDELCAYRVAVQGG